MAAAVAELTGLPISQAIDLFEQHGSVVAAVSAHFDRMLLVAHGTTTTDSSGPQSSHHGAGAGAPAADARRQSPSGPAPSVDGILGKARDVAAPITGPMGGVGRSLAEPPTVPTGNRHERKIDVVFFRDGVGFLELPADGSQAARKTGMHTFEKRPTLPAELESLEGHRVLLALPSSDPRYKPTIADLDESKVPTVLIQEADRTRDTGFALVLRDARAHSISSLAVLDAAGKAPAAGSTYGGAGRSLGGAHHPQDATKPPVVAPDVVARMGGGAVQIAGAAVMAAGAAIVAGGLEPRQGIPLAVLAGACVYAVTHLGQKTPLLSVDNRPKEIHVDPDLPTTTIKVRLAVPDGDGGQAPTQTVSITFNDHVHTVSDLYHRVQQVSLEQGHFALMSGFPPLLLKPNDTTTIAKAGLQSALVTQRAIPAHVLP
jgi:hypothetical protein